MGAGNKTNFRADCGFALYGDKCMSDEYHAVPQLGPGFCMYTSCRRVPPGTTNTHGKFTVPSNVVTVHDKKVRILLPHPVSLTEGSAWHVTPHTHIEGL